MVYCSICEVGLESARLRGPTWAHFRVRLLARSIIILYRDRPQSALEELGEIKQQLG